MYLRQYCKFSTLQKKTPIILYSKVYNHHYVIIKHQIYTQLCSETTTLCNKFNIDSCVVQIDVASYCKRLFSEVLSEGLIIDTLSVHITYKQHRRGLKVKVWYKQDKRWSADTETRNERTWSRKFLKKDGWKGWTYSNSYDLSSCWLLILLELCHYSMTS